MDSLAGYGSDDDVDTERYVGNPTSVAAARRREDDTNYDDVNMDMSEDSQESEPELPPAEPAPQQRSPRSDRRGSDDSRETDRDREFERDRRDRRRESPHRSRSDREKDRRSSPRKDDKYRSERSDRGRSFEGNSRRGLLGDRPDDRSESKGPPSLMDVKPFAGESSQTYDQRRSQDARDAVSPRFVERDRRDRDRERERDRDGRHGRRPEEGRSGYRHSERSERKDRSRSRSRSKPYPPSGSHSSSSSERRGSPPSGDYRPSSYKVNKKLEVMEKMGLQIKTPDGSMATAQQLRAAAGDSGPPGSLPSYYNPSGHASKILDQVQKRKLLWANKNKSEAEEAAKWSGTRFAQDSDGKQVSKFMRLMGIKEPGAVKPETVDKTVDPIKKQEELFQAMQAQYEVARATTHTMRGVGLGFQRSHF